jgi:hypothetical protein
MKRAGILNALERKHYPRRMEDLLSEPPAGMTLKRVQVFFVCLGTGYLLAVLLFILETRVHRMTLKRNIKRQLALKKCYSIPFPFIN